MAEKRRRIEARQFLNCRDRVSNSALAGILEGVRGNTDILQGAISAKTLSRDEAKVFNACRAEVTLQSRSGKFTLPFADPALMLTYLVDNSNFLRERFAELDTQHLELLLYTDEICPGNPLHQRNLRKMSAYYFSFDQFKQNLTREEFWFPLCIIRSSAVKSIEGGLPAVTSALLMELKTRLASGVLLRLPRATLFMVSFKTFIADEGAIKASFAIKGAAGLKPCMLCLNVVSCSSGLAGLDRQGFLQDIACADTTRFRAATDADIWEAADTLKRAAETSSKAVIQDLEKRLGMTWNPNGPLMQPSLRNWYFPAKSLRYDYMHVHLSNGIANMEFGLFFGFLKQKKFNRPPATTWTWPPGCVEGKLAEKFVSEGDEEYRTDASVVLAAYPLIRHFAVSTPSLQQPVFAKHLNSLLALCHSLDLFQQAKHCHDAGKMQELAQPLRAAVAAHLTKFVECYGKEQVKPKHHMATHLVDMMLQSSWLDCFVLEKKHKKTKFSTEMVTRTTSYESSSLQKVLLANLMQLRSAAVGDQLQNGVTAFSPLGPTALIAKQALIRPHVIRAGDLVMLRSRTFTVGACAQADQSFYLLLQELQPMGATISLTRWQAPESTALAEVWLVDDNLRSELRHSHCWREEDGRIFAIRGFEVATQ